MISQRDAQTVARIADQCLGPGAEPKREARRAYNTAVGRLMAAPQRGATDAEIEVLQEAVREARCGLRKVMGWPGN